MSSLLPLLPILILGMKDGINISQMLGHSRSHYPPLSYLVRIRPGGSVIDLETISIGTYDDWSIKTPENSVAS